MKVIQIFLFSLAFIVVLASATINIIYPSAQYYLVAGQTNDVLWTFNTTDVFPFSIYLTNPNISDLKQLALANNIIPSLGKTNVSLGSTFVSTGFQLMFTNIVNINDVYATSENFEIKPSDTVPTVYVSPTPTTASATPTSSNNNNTKDNNTSNKNSSNSIHNYGFGILVLITLLTIILF